MLLGYTLLRARVVCTRTSGSWNMKCLFWQRFVRKLRKKRRDERFLSRCNEGEFHALFQRLSENRVKHRRQPPGPPVFGFRTADATLAVIGSGDNDRETGGGGAWARSCHLRRPKAFCPRPDWVMAFLFECFCTPSRIPIYWTFFVFGLKRCERALFHCVKRP
jgi:hypothetical protein